MTLNVLESFTHSSLIWRLSQGNLLKWANAMKKKARQQTKMSFHGGCKTVVTLLKSAGKLTIKCNPTNLYEYVLAVMRKKKALAHLSKKLISWESNAPSTTLKQN